MIRTSRYMCPDHQGTRVFPYDGAMRDSGVLSPEDGKRGRPILLATHNNGRLDTKTAFCFAGMHWVEAAKLTEHDLAMLYAGLIGVVRFRAPQRRQLPTGKQQLAKIIEGRFRKARIQRTA